jgi:hypothetical protein
MADKNIQMTQRNASNTGWDNLYPITKASNVQVTPISGLVGTDVQTVLQNLFQFANDGKTGVATVIGSPATIGDTFSQLVTHIQNAKNTMATNLSNKGVAASGTEALQALADKIANVNTGKKWAYGNETVVSTDSTGAPYTYYINLDGKIGFTPSIIFFRVNTSQSGNKPLGIYTHSNKISSIPVQTGANSGAGGYILWETGHYSDTIAGLNKLSVYRDVNSTQSIITSVDWWAYE